MRDQDRLTRMSRYPRLLVAATLSVLAAAACTAASTSPGAAGSAIPSAAESSASPSAAISGPTVGGPVASPVPGSPAGTGQTPPSITPGGPDASGIPAPSPIEVQPIGGLPNAHDVKATSVEAAMSGSHIIATLFWWSGPSPCTELSEVKVDNVGAAFTLTVREGSRNLGIACPALAVYKTTRVDLGPVMPGAYTVNAYGVDHPATVTYTG
jgi:hypothetical protein